MSIIEMPGGRPDADQVYGAAPPAPPAVQAVMGALAALVWRYAPERAKVAAPQTVSVCAESVALSKELKKRGWKFVGPTTVYAFMQAMGLINDHVEGCVIRPVVERVGRRKEA